MLFLLKNDIFSSQGVHIMSRATLYRRLKRTLEENADIHTSIPSSNLECGNETLGLNLSMSPGGRTAPDGDHLDGSLSCEYHNETSCNDGPSMESVTSPLSDDDGDNEDWYECIEWSDSSEEGGTEGDGSDDDDTECGSFREGSLRSRLARWANEYNISHAALLALLAILSCCPTLNLPKDPRTLLHTPLTSQTTSMGNGTYHFFGLKSSVLNILGKLPSMPTCRRLCIQLAHAH